METCFPVMFTCLSLFALSINTMMLNSSSNVTCVESKRYSLLAFKQTLWYTYDFLSTWEGAECCEWKGVGCDIRNGHVVKLDLRSPPVEVLDDDTRGDIDYKLLRGDVSPKLQNLTHLRYLDLSMNYLFGNIPEFFGCLGNLSQLTVLDIANNNLSGLVPGSLGSLDLWSLHLQNNKFKGNIPVTFQNLTSLMTLGLGNNFFIGNIPYWIGEKLPNLRILDLRSNKFTGKIPLELCQLNRLHYLSLAHNDLTGTIPRCFTNISGMISISKSYGLDTRYYEEKVLVTIKGRQLWYHKAILYLTSLGLSSNNLVGEIPDALMKLVGLINLNLSRNLLKGHIPMTIGDLRQSESLDLSINKLSGRIPQSLSTLNFLSSLNMSFNNLSGAIPVGNHIQTLDDPSIYKGNNELCGPPVSTSCNGNDVSDNQVDQYEGKDDNCRRVFLRL